jgi:ketosteroid isomerase-like protein
MNRLVPFIVLVAVAVTAQAFQRQEQSRLLERIRNQGEYRVTTKDTIQGYFNSLKQKKGWESFLADDMIFTSYTSPIKQVTGKDAYLESTKRFYSGIISFEVKDLLIEAERACALTHYELQSPKGPFTSDVAEIFTVRNGKIASFAIYFDSAPFSK